MMICFSRNIAVNTKQTMWRRIIFNI